MPGEHRERFCIICFSSIQKHCNIPASFTFLTLHNILHYLLQNDSCQSRYFQAAPDSRTMVVPHTPQSILFFLPFDSYRHRYFAQSDSWIATLFFPPTLSKAAIADNRHSLILPALCSFLKYSTHLQDVSNLYAIAYRSLPATLFLHSTRSAHH